MNIFIVIPAHNEEKRIGKVLKELKKVKYTTLVIDDGSTDNTYKIAKDNCDYVLKHKVNLGKGAAMKTGAKAAFKLGAEAIVFMDSDGQHVVDDFDEFVKALEKVMDAKYGARIFDMQVPLVRYLVNKIISLTVSLLFGVYVSDILCGFKAMTKDSYKKVKWESSFYGVETEIIIRAAKNNLKHCEVPVAAVYLESYKGMTFSHAFSLIFDIFRWRITI